MGIQQFETIMLVWNILFFALIIFCVFLAIISVKRNNKKFVVSYVLEGITIAVNLFFMYIIDSGFIDYGNDKFSGLSALGDWLGFGVLILITLIPLVITIVCNICYVVKKRKKARRPTMKSQ